MARQTASMALPKEKLKSLETYINGQNENVYLFGLFLAEFLNDNLHPQGFVTSCELAIHCLQTGMGKDKKPFVHKLAKKPSAVYGELRKAIPTIAVAVMPQGFSFEVKQILHETLFSTEKKYSVKK